MEEPKSKKPSVQTILIVGFLLIILIAVGFGIFIMQEIQKQNAALLLAQQQQEVPVAPYLDPNTTAGKAYIVDESNLDTVMEDAQEEINDGMFTTNMSTIWTFDDAADKAIDAFLANDESNKRSFVVDVTLDETGESVFTSTVIPVGKQIKEIKLSKDLPAGNYNATVNYTMLDKNNKESGIFGVGITIVVQK